MQAVSVTEEMVWIDICNIGDLVINIGTCALVNNRQVAIFRLSGSDKIYAIDNYDPFSDSSVLSRGVVGDIKGQPVVASPIFKQHFNLETGQCLEDESVKLETYSVRVVDSIVQLASK